MIKLSIIIVNRNVSGFLKRCLQSILNSPVMSAMETEIIVVDSGSTDNSLDMLSHFPMIQLISQLENIGFTKCANVGLSVSKGRYILLLNPDTEILDDALVQCVKFLEKNPSVGIVGPQILNSDGTLRPAKRHFPSLKHELLRYSWLKNFANHLAENNDSLGNGNYCDAEEVDWVNGSALVMRRDVYNMVGGLDEEFVMYYEEIDFCRRAKKSAWRIMFLTQPKIIHYQGQSSKQVPVLRRHYHRQSQLTYFRKYHSKSVFLVLWLLSPMHIY